MTEKTRTIVTMSPHMKEKLAQTAEKQGCSQAEVLRNAFIRAVEADS
ncbi:hypothetical protein [Methanoregula formicica]|uniref:Ribbon-helix-helix protein, copG family n=1 Tax=Methanoregula formicica (strain DSM 22288 / NBRC 105244 / SMSP) TaxID=593750 RepID=L0HI88_METFS|nr:hypothetical protein [Methanoregula formicica]AGB03033.1 hypothetical protein Metfor_2019 [Methanoregula formicica SMSP]